MSRMNLLKMLSLELGKDHLENRRYFAELAILLSLLILALYVLLSILAGLLIQSDNSLLLGLGALAYLFNVYMCHQMPERAFFIFGQQMGLCERCLAIMVGALAAYPIAFNGRRLPRVLRDGRMMLAAIVLAIGLLGIDGVAQLLGWWESSAAVRVATGFASAFTVMYYLLTEVLDKYPPKRHLFRNGTVIPVLIPFALLFAGLLAFSLFMGSNYKTESYFIEKAKEMSPGASQYLAYYIAPRAFAGSIGADNYLQKYDDPVLSDVARMDNRAHAMGAWAIIALNEPAKHEGEYAFISGGSGTYYYFDAWSGELLAAKPHSR